MSSVQRERPVANTPDEHRFDDWTKAIVVDYASTLPNEDDRRRFFESVIRVGAWARYGDQVQLEALDFLRAAHEAKVQRGT
jgi:hypothetical protein